MRPAVVIDNKVLDASTEANVVGPTSKNLHEYNSLSTCVMIDLMGPPYCDELGRECHYFKPYVPSPSESESALNLSNPMELKPNSTVWLMSDYPQFLCEPWEYNGPFVTVSS